MRYFAAILLLAACAVSGAAQTPSPTPKKTPKPAKTVAPKPATEAEEFAKAQAIADAVLRIAALKAFLVKFPESAEKVRALGLIVSARAELADKKLAAGETEAGIELFKLAVAEAPVPFPKELFVNVVRGFPLNLFARDQRGPAFDLAKAIEEKAGDNPSYLLDLSRFFIGVQYGTEAIRLAEKATTLDAASAAGFQVLANAYRLNFRLDDAAAAYAKAVELDPELASARVSLAEMKRALGKSDDAAAIYRSILEKTPDDAAARAGLALALVEGEKPAEAEPELDKALESDPLNPVLLTGAAYWYARRGQNEKAVELARRASTADPSSLFAYIAEARALTALGKPLEAERVLNVARRAADLPTLDYELATVRLAAGLYREAAEILKRNFAINKDGNIETYLGNRILADAGSFTELLSLERRVTIFQKPAVDDAESASRMKALMVFVQKLESPDATIEETAAAADAFANGADRMRTHRFIFAASRLLQKKDSSAKVLELTQAAVGGVDSALDVPAPSAAVMADELYDSRQYALGQNLVLSVADVPRPTLLAVLRGRLEDIAGQAYIAQDNFPQAIVRLKRALSVFPDKSAFSRASWRRLGEIYQSQGKEKEALEALIRSYNKDFPDYPQREVIEALYLKVNGNIDGLEERVGPKRETTVATTEPTPSPTPVATPTPSTEPTPTIPSSLPEDVPIIAVPSPTPEASPSVTPTPAVSPTPTPEVTPTPEATPAPTPEVTPTPEATPAPTPEVTPTPEATPAPTPEVTPTPEATPSPTPEVTPTPVTTPAPTPETTPTPEVTPSPTPEVAPTPEVTPTPEVAKSPEPTNPSETEPRLDTTNKPGELSTITPRGGQFPPSPKVEKKPETEPTPTETDKPKSIFDPVIIQVGETRPQTETKSTDADQTKTPPPVDDKILSGDVRPRVIVTDNSSGKTVSQEIVACRLNVNPDTLTINSMGGPVSISAGFDGEGDYREITATAVNARDIEIVSDPGLGESRRRAFFIMRSISDETGNFTIVFEAPCGRKEIVVRVK